jgi:LPS-assembly protein
MHVILYLFVLLFYLLSSNPVFAEQQGEIFINADSMTRDLDAKSVDLEGHVQIVFKNQHISADHATVYLMRKEFIADGNVTLTTTKATAGGDKILMNYNANTGTIYSGYVKSGQILLEGDVIEKNGEDLYSAYDANYTSCLNCPPAWSFSGTAIDAQIEGYAKIKNAILRISNFPVFWFPYLVVPLKSNRQSGLLTPHFRNSSDNEFIFYQPYFFALSKSQDATYTLANYSKRGPKSIGEYRFVLGPNNYGQLDIATLQDRVFVNDEQLKKFKQPSESQSFHRWFLNYTHHFELPNRWVSRAKIETLSDLRYPIDFNDEFVGYGDPAIDNRISIDKSTDHYFFGIDNSYYINLLQSNPLATNQDAVHRLPEIRLSSTEQEISTTGLLFKFDIDYTNFTRNNFAYDDMVKGTTEAPDYSPGRTVRTVYNSCTSKVNPKWEQDPNCKALRDGKFNPDTDIIRSGQRMILQPSISAPMNWGDFIDVLPRVSYREVHYNFGVTETPNINSRLVRTEISTRTTLSKLYGDSNESNSDQFKHEVQPEIIATQIPWIDLPDHSFFGFDKSADVPYFNRNSISDSDLFGSNGVQFDYDDRIFDKDLLTFRVTNKLIRKSWNNNTASYQQIGFLRISQSYDGTEAKLRGADKGWSSIDVLLDVRWSDWFNTLTTINFFPYQDASNVSSSVSLRDQKGNMGSLGLTRSFSIDPDSDQVDYNSRTEDWDLMLGTSVKYANIIGMAVYNGNKETAKESRIKAWRAGVEIKPPGKCWNIFLLAKQVVGKPGVELVVYPTFRFDGSSLDQLNLPILQSY